MDLIDQYLRAVAALLPRAQRDDITAELRDIILSRIEARESALGRPLTEAEIEEELRVVGHPILVAARYRDEPQHLVGPSLYPYWMFAVKIAITIQLAVAVLGLLLRTISGQDFGYSLGQAISHTLTSAIMLIGIATVAAWLIERGKVHVAYLDHWRVRDLAVLEYAGWDFTDLCNLFRQAPTRERTRAHARAAMREERRHLWRRHQRSPISQGIFHVAFGTVFLLWWTGVIPLTIFAPSDGLHRLHTNLFDLSGMNLADLHGAMFWPVLFYGAAVIVRGALTVIFPGAIRFRGLLNILMGAVTLTFCAWLWMASPIASAIRVGSLEELALKLQQGMHHGLPQPVAPILTFVTACEAFAAIIQIVRGAWEMLILPGQEN
jgi:hypothetical protein